MALECLLRVFYTKLNELYTNMSFERRLTYKIYQEDGTFIETLNDVVSDFTIKRQINGGDSEFVFELDRKMDDFDEGTSIQFNNRVKVYLKDSYNSAGTKLIANGYIVSYKPFLLGKKEGVEVTCLSAISKLSNDFYRLGTFADATDLSDPANLGKELTNKRVDEMMQDIIDHYRLTEANSMITNDYGNADQTTDNSGNLFAFDHRFFNMKHIDALREVSKFLPRNKVGGYWFYWRISTEGDLYLKNISSTADHTFHISKHIKEISGRKTIEGVVNRVYFYNEKGASDPDYIQLTADDSTSQDNYDIMAEYITDSKVTYPTAASLLTSSKVYDKKDPKVRIEVTLNGEYDLSSIKPGQTCKILNVKNNPFKIGSDNILVIHSIEYSVDEAKLTLAEAADSFEDIVENERQRLDKEMTWFGFITQQLTAAQLGPANRTWSTDIVFSATSGANAYRQVDWTTGTVYLPSGAAGSAGKRVIDSGDTGLMSAATDYYIYLDEETFNTSASNSDSGTGIIKQGGDALYDSGKSWSNDQYKGYILTIGGETKIIRSNTATVLSIEDGWTISDQTAAYTIKKMTFDVTTDKTIISDLTKIIFSNVRANAVTTSEVLIGSPLGASSAAIPIWDGATNIAKRSIIADRIVADTITSNEINTGAINIGDWGGDSSDITQASNYKFVTNNEETGAGRAYSGLDVNSRLALGFYDTGLDAVLALPTDGVRIDSRGIYGREAGVTKFYISSAGNAYFSGTIEASTITGGTLQTSTSGQRIVISTTDDIKLYGASGSASQIYSDTGNFLRLEAPNTVSLYVNGAQIIGVTSSVFFTNKNFEPSSIGLTLGLPAGGTWKDIYFAGGANTGIFLASSILLELFGANNIYSKHFGPYASNTYDLGSDTIYWRTLYYGTSVKKGAFGFLDKGIELQDGKVVSDLEALMQMKEDPKLITPYGSTGIDYKSLPKIVFRKATDSSDKELPRDSKGAYKMLTPEDKGGLKEGTKKVRVEDGEDVNAMISIIIGAIRELGADVNKIKKTINVV